jgi:hypothetical protein
MLVSMARYFYRKSYNWNPDLAYVAGLFASDGCLINDGRHLTLVSNDLEILDNTKRILKSKATIGQKTGGFGTQSHFLAMGDVALYDFFLKAGIHPAKSLTIQKVDVPDEYYRDFLRGHFDGDGCIAGYKDSRWPKSYMYYMSICGASPPFIEWIQQKNGLLANTTRAAIWKGDPVWQLRYAKSDARKLFNFMYYASNLPLLSRKYRKFLDFLTADPYYNMVQHSKT